MTEPPPIRLRRFLQFDSNSRDEVRDVLVHRYGASDFDLRHDGDALHGIGSLLRLKGIDLGYLAFSADVQATIPSAGFFRQQFALAGFGQTTFGGSRFDVSTNDSGVIPADADATYHFDRNLSQLVLRVSARALQVKLASWIGRPVSRNVQFAPSTTFQNPRQLQLRRLISFFVGEIDDENVEWSDLVRAEFEQMLIVAFLTGHQHNFSALLEGGSPSAAPWQVRVVEEYIEANWKQPVTIEALAEATGVGVRSMFKTFEQARGYSPMSFVKHIRLEHARRMLQAPDETTSVTGVCLFCGFGNVGHFARYYREAFGELPVATLAAAKGARRRAKAK
jgi:AraC-like DNA-binding protein